MRGAASWARARARFAALPLALVAAACGDGPTDPGDAEVRLVVVAGAGQRGLEGRELLVPVAVRAEDGDGLPVAGVPIRVRALGGGAPGPGSTVTGAQGLVRLPWTLGPADGGPQVLRFETEHDAVDVAAEVLPLDRGELLVVRGARGPMKGAVVVATGRAGGVEVVERLATRDTLIRLQPRDGGDHSVVVFPTVDRPEWIRPAWSAGVDTAEVALRGPVPLAVTVRVHVGPLATKLEEVEDDLEAARDVFAEQGAGVEIAKVVIVDLTEGSDSISIDGARACSQSTLGSGIDISYVHDIVTFWGYGCTTGKVWMSDERQGLPYLLAHEIGHTFALPHTQTGLMVSATPGRDLTEAEIFRIHFGAASVVNTIFASQPASLWRFCGAPGECLPDGLVLQPAGVS